MIETLKELTIGDMLTIDDSTSKDFTSQEDFVIDAIHEYNCDEVEVLIIDLGDYNLISTNISGIIRFAVCEEYDEAKYYMDQEDFLDEIEINGGETVDTYQQNDAIYNCDENDTSFAEYLSLTCDFNYALIHTDKDDSILYRGVTVEENQIIL